MTTNELYMITALDADGGRVTRWEYRDRSEADAVKALIESGDSEITCVIEPQERESRREVLSRLVGMMDGDSPKSIEFSTTGEMIHLRFDAHDAVEAWSALLGIGWDGGPRAVGVNLHSSALGVWRGWLVSLAAMTPVPAEPVVEVVVEHRELPRSDERQPWMCACGAEFEYGVALGRHVSVQASLAGDVAVAS